MIRWLLNKTIYRNHMTMDEVKKMLGQYKLIVKIDRAEIYNHTLTEMMLICEMQGTDTYKIELGWGKNPNEQRR